MTIELPRAARGTGAHRVHHSDALFIFHNFWTYPPAEQQVQTAMFLKNLAIMGGLPVVAAFGAGAYGFDRRK